MRKYIGLSLMVLSILCTSNASADVVKNFGYKDNQYTTTSGNQVSCAGNLYGADKIITGSDFYYSGKHDEVAKRYDDYWTGIGGSSKTVTCCTRDAISMSATTYVMTLLTKNTENATLTLPKIIIGGKEYTADKVIVGGNEQSFSGNQYAYTGGTETTLSYSITIASAADYNVSVEFNSGYKEKFLVKSLTISSTSTTTITIDANTSHHGSTTPGNVIASLGSELPSFDAATGASGYGLTGYWTEADGGTKIINSDGTLVANTTYTADGKWNSDVSTLTLYAQYAPAFAVTVNVNDANYGTASASSAAYAEGTTVTIVATPKNGYAFDSWTSDDVTFADASSASTTFTMPASAVTVQANFIINPCINTKTIQCEDYVDYSTQPSGSSYSKPGELRKENYTGYGAPSNGYYADFKGSAGEMWIPVTLPAGEFTFEIRYAKSGTFNLYSVGSGTKIQSASLGYRGDNLGESSTSAYTLPAGDYVIGLEGGEYAAFDQVVITASSTVFCPDETYELTTSASNGSVANDAVDATAIPSGTKVTLTATPDAGYTFDHWENEAGTTLSMANPFVFSITKDTAITAVFVKAYVAWPWKSATDTFAMDASQWTEQLVLGPEHFTKATVGGKLVISICDVAGNAEGAIQGARGYANPDVNGRAYLMSGTEVTYKEGIRNFYISGTGFYHVFTAASLEMAKRQGLVIKGFGYSITQVLVLPASPSDPMRDPMTELKYGTTEDEHFSNFHLVHPNFAFGEWEHKVNFVPRAFDRAEVGNVLRVSVAAESGALEPTVSFRCDVDTIMADSQGDAIKWVRTTGDISFDRTITNLWGNPPDDEGSVDMYIDADMLARLKTGGLIVCGQGAIMKDIELIVGPFVIGSPSTTEAKLVPKCGVDTLVIYQGSQATNRDTIKVYRAVQYVRPAVGGVKGNVLGQWYTFTMPFEVSKIYSVEESTGTEYEINSIYRDGEKEDSRNPSGEGSFWLEYLRNNNDETDSGVEDVFRSRWAYIDQKYPKVNVPYIILFKSFNGGDTWFTDNPLVKFTGVPTPGSVLKIAGKKALDPIPADGERYYYYPNNTCHNMKIGGSAYLLDGDGRYFRLTENAVVPPFECYVQATDAFKAKYPNKIAFFRNGAGNDPIATGIPYDVDDSHWRIFDITGHYYGEGTGEPQWDKMASGIYILCIGQDRYKVIRP